LSPSGTTGTASCAIDYFPSASGAQEIDAAYQGDSVFAKSTSSAALTVSESQMPSSSGGGSGSTGGGSGGGGSGAVGGGSGSVGGGSGATASAGAAASGGSGSAAGSGSQPPSAAAGPGTSSAAAPTPGIGASQPACLAPTGRLTGSTLGLVTLGMTRTQARAAYRPAKFGSAPYQDFFCLTPSGLRVGYPSPGLLRALSGGQRRQLSGRVIWATTANPRYAAGAIRPGARLAAARRALGAATVVRLGGVAWYFLPGRSATVVVQVRAGAVRELGIAASQLTRTPKAESLLARSLS
jgi:hypothetical protein